MPYAIRRYLPDDEGSWLRCRVLGFLDSSYYDDVQISKQDSDALVQLIAVRADGEVIGILDASLKEGEATLETIAVHPDHRRRGIADALLDTARGLLDAAGGLTLTAWTRQDAAASAWYSRNGFVETFRYVHVHANSYREHLDPVVMNGMRLVAGFFHASIEEEARLRARYGRVYVCRSLTLPLG